MYIGWISGGPPTVAQQLTASNNGYTPYPSLPASPLTLLFSSISLSAILTRCDSDCCSGADNYATILCSPTKLAVEALKPKYCMLLTTSPYASLVLAVIVLHLAIQLASAQPNPTWFPSVAALHSVSVRDSHSTATHRFPIHSFPPPCDIIVLAPSRMKY